MSEATATTVELSKDRAVNLVVELGWKAASDWDAERLCRKLGEIDTVYDSEQVIEDEQIKADLDEVLAGIQNGASFVVSESVTQETSETTSEAGSESGESGGGSDAFFADANAEKDKKPKRKAKPKKDTGPKIPGLRLIKSRAYHAAQVIKAVGLQAGITDAMVAQVDELYGEVNEKYSRYALTNAWHALNGYLEEIPIPAKEDTATSSNENSSEG